MKKLFKNKKIIFSLLCLIVGGLFFWQWSSRSRPSSNYNLWLSYKKDQKSNKNIKARASEQELQKILAAKVQPQTEGENGEPSLSRSPASVGLYEGREVVGAGAQYLGPADYQVRPTNKFNQEWQQLMADELLARQEDKTQLFVKHQKSLFQIKGQKGRYIELVTVSFLMPDGQRSSYKALVDSQTGAVLKTWDRSLSEKSQKKRLEL